MIETTPPRLVPQHTLRQLFNEGFYYERVQDGTLIAEVWEQWHPSPKRSCQPDCTHSQMVLYTEQDGTPVAYVHQYLRPDRRLGASGRPDPKMLVVGGELLAIDESTIQRTSCATPAELMPNESFG